MIDWIESLSLPVLFGVVLAACVSMTLVGLAMGYAAEAYWHPRGRKVFDLPLAKNQLRTELLGTALFHAVFVPSLVVLLHTRVIHFTPFSRGGFLAEALGFAVPWYGFMCFYYFLHRGMHHPRLFWMHKWHHESRVTTPMTGFSMHPAEAVGWVIGMLGPCVLLSAFDLLGFWGWASWLFFIWSGNVAGHANAEMFPLRSTPGSTIVSNPISYHSLHHARFTGHYGFVAAFMDRAFGTEFADWKEVHDRVYDGQPMTSLRHKGPSYGIKAHPSQEPTHES